MNGSLNAIVDDNNRCFASRTKRENAQHIGVSAL